MTTILTIVCDACLTSCWSTVKCSGGLVCNIIDNLRVHSATIVALCANNTILQHKNYVHTTAETARVLIAVR